MKINYIKNNYIDNMYRRNCNYIIEDIHLCCEDMKNSLEENLLNVGYYYDWCNKEVSYCIGAISKRKVVKKFNVCPYCGKPIIMNKIREIDKDIYVCSGVDNEIRKYTFNYNNKKWKFEDDVYLINNNNNNYNNRFEFIKIKINDNKIIDKDFYNGKYIYYGFKDNYDTIGMPYGIFLNTYFYEENFYEEKGREVIEKCNSSGLTPECFDNIMWLKSKDCEEIK